MTLKEHLDYKGVFKNPYEFSVGTLLNTSQEKGKAVYEGDGGDVDWSWGIYYDINKVVEVIGESKEDIVINVFDTRDGYDSFYFASELDSEY